MNTVLIQECTRFNKLLSYMQVQLPLLIKALKGLVVMSGDLDAMGSAIAMNLVPEQWEKRAYPSLMGFESWVDDLCSRLGFIGDWVEYGTPACFWISGFYFPQGFLTGAKQNYARKHGFPIDTIEFDFKVIETPWAEIKEKPEDGVFLRGLFLEGARWDPEIGYLNDSLPKQLYTSMPVLMFVPVKDRVFPTAGVYQLPIYKVLGRAGILATTGHSTNFVMWIEIPSNRGDIINNVGAADQDHWIKAGVAAFCSLKY